MAELIPKRRKDYRRAAVKMLLELQRRTPPAGADIEQALERLYIAFHDEAGPLIGAMHEKFVVGEISEAVYFGLTVGLEGVLAIISLQQEEAQGSEDVPEPEYASDLLASRTAHTVIDVADPIHWLPRHRSEYADALDKLAGILNGMVVHIVASTLDQSMTGRVSGPAYHALVGCLQGMRTIVALEQDRLKQIGDRPGPLYPLPVQHTGE